MMQTAYARGADIVVVVHHDDPVGQGAISYSRAGRGYHSNGKRLKPWRRAIVAAAAAVVGENDPLTGPCILDVTVTVPKPKSAPKTRITWPVTRSSGDVDHHLRAVCDSLSQARVWGDDSQVVEACARKVYPGEGVYALDSPGAVIHVWRAAS